jgi:hypothetical protein
MYQRWRTRFARGGRSAGTLLVGSLLVAALPSAGVFAAGPGPNVISGVTQRDGIAVPGGTVTVEVVPQPKDAATAPAGVAIPMEVVAQGRTDARGRFNLTAAAVPASFTDEFGVANFVAIVSDGTHQVQWSFPLIVGMPSTKTAVGRNVDLKIDLGSNPGVADTANPPTSWHGVKRDQLTPDGLVPVAMSPAVVAPSSGSDASPMFCTTTWTNNYKYGIPEAFANEWGWTGALGTFHEALSTSHTLGIAIDLGGGSWRAGGTWGLSESDGAEANTSGLWDNQINNEVNYREQWNGCDLHWYWYPVSTYAIEYPILGWPHTSHPHWTSCAVYGNGQDATKTQGTNTTYAYGVGFGPINLSTQSGWSTAVSNKWTFTSTSHLCGSTSFGWVSSPEAEAHQ